MAKWFWIGAALVAGLALAGPGIAQSNVKLPDFVAASPTLAAGHYACRDGDVFTSQFDVIDQVTYRYTAQDAVDSALSLDPASGEIRFVDGPYASDEKDTTVVTGYNTVRKDDGQPVILLHYADPAYGESTEYCPLVGD